MIDLDNLTSEWVKEVSKKHKKADMGLVDRVIHALLLVEGLAKQKVNFVFKGGTALMLLFGSTKRLSIDIDIILPAKPDNIEEIFNTIANEQGFTRVEQQERKVNNKINKEHYKFYYTPLHKANGEETYILLDILLEEVNYINVLQIPIQSSFVPEAGEIISVNIPSFEDILGDKLTAFAPNTTGIPFFKNEDDMSMEIIKQLYDIGNIFESVNDLSVIKSTFRKFAKTEIGYGEKPDLNDDDVLEDIYQTSMCISTRGANGKGDFNQLQSGVQRIKQYIFSESYQIEKAITHSAKAAYLSSLIKNDSSKIEKFESPEQIKDKEIKNQSIKKLNRLKKSNSEAFFYWYKSYELEPEGKSANISRE
ncbi:MAG: nucleotidyl transferase AbiEii/AbiGii toxin family protein [Ignavibacteria bacterium]|nr:nucleotidyl transferase AbiEii/AbiGii toxin family protein [Ignavibacteria bacterium]